MIKKLICKIKGHNFKKLSNSYKRKCIRCNLEEWIFKRSFSETGKPDYFWKNINDK